MTLSTVPLPSTDSPLARIDPRWRLAGILVLMIAIAALRSLPLVGIGVAITLTLTVCSRMPVRWYLVRLASLGFFLGFFLVTFPIFVREDDPLFGWGWLTLSWTGLRLALVVAGKAVSLFTLALVLLVTAPLHRTLTAAHSLRIPGLVIQVTLLAYHYLLLMTREMRRMWIALRVRGFRLRTSIHSYRTVGNLTGSLLVRGHDRAERVGHAMRCRGFDGRFRSLTDFQTRCWDVAFFAGMCGIAVGMLVYEYLGRFL